MMPTAWMRACHTPSSPNGPEEWDAEFSYGDDPPDGDGWIPLYAERQISTLLADHDHDRLQGALTLELRDALLAMGDVEWGATAEKTDAEHIDDFRSTLALTREHFNTPERQRLHGVYQAGTETVICHTGTSPNSPNHARLIVGFLNHAHAVLALALARGESAPERRDG